MNGTALTAALISDVFFSADGLHRLDAALSEARGLGAALALLPELPLNPWSPAGQHARDDDAEPPEGPRHLAQAAAARRAGIGLVGGVILREPLTGRRYNQALVFDGGGRLLGSYRKLHLPEEDGFWETSHYEPGDEPPAVIDGLPMPVGIQICSDSHRPDGSHLLAALGAEAILVPRATEPSTFDRWRLVLTANARITATYVLSVNRPEPGLRIALGGPSIAVAPDGRVLVETTERIALVELTREAVAAAKRGYPGYVPFRADVYAKGWAAAAMKRRV